MAWADLASNQMVSYTDAQTSGFALQSGQSQVTSNQCMTKNDALAKYVLDSAYMTSYASNQLVPKSTWVSGVVSYSHFFSSIGSPISSGTCFFTTDMELYSSSSSLGPSVVIYTDSDLLTPFFGMDQWYAGDGGKTYLINNSGVITSEYIC